MPKVVIDQVTKPARGSPRMNPAAASSRTLATSVAATMPGGSRDASRVAAGPPTPCAFAAVSPAAVSAIPARMLSTCGGWYPAASSSDTTSTRARKATRPISSDSHGSPSRTTARMIGPRIAAVRRRVRSIGSAAEAPFAAREVGQGLVAVLRRELGPVLGAGDQLGVRRLPDQEVAGPHVPAGPDEQVDVRLAARVQVGREMGLVDGLRIDPRGDELPGGVHDLRPARVVEADVEV